MILQFFVPGKPVGKERPRSAGNGHFYTPKKTLDYEKLVRLCAIQAVAQLEEGWPADCSYSVDIEISEKGADVVVLPVTRLKRSCKSDLDNIAKSILDGLEGVLYPNDSRVTCVMIEDEGK